MSPYEELANAIIEQAVKDFKRLCAQLGESISKESKESKVISHEGQVAEEV